MRPWAPPSQGDRLPPTGTVTRTACWLLGGALCVHEVGGQVGGELSCQEKRRKLGTQKGTTEEGGRSSLASYALAHSLNSSTR